MEVKLDGKVMKEIEVSDFENFTNVEVWASNGLQGYPPADAEIQNFSRLSMEE